MSLPVPTRQYKFQVVGARLRRGAAVLVCAASLSGLAPALAADVRVTGAWVRANAPGVAKAAAYLTLVNESARELRLIGAASPAAERVQLHRTVESDGQSRMERQTGGVAVPARGERRFQPGGLHIMLMDLEHDLEAGEALPLVLTFDDGAKRRVSVPIKPLTWSPAGD